MMSLNQALHKHNPPDVSTIYFQFTIAYNVANALSFLKPTAFKFKKGFQINIVKYHTTIKL